MKKYNTIIFDLDGTLAVTKSPLTDEMGQLVAQLTQKINVVIITGGRFEQIKKQVIDRLGENVVRSNFYVLPTTGSSMVAYDSKTKEWNYVYRHELTNEQKERIINGIKQALEQASFSINPDDVFENQFEDRGSQITFSALGISKTGNQDCMGS